MSDPICQNCGRPHSEHIALTDASGYGYFASRHFACPTSVFELAEIQPDDALAKSIAAMIEDPGRGRS